MLSRITARFTRSSNTAPEEPAAAPSPRLREAQRKFSGDASQPIKPSTKPSNAQYYASGETDVAPKSSKKSVLFSYKPPKLATVSEDRYGFV
ncbi:MAG TPA: hypothetical protein VFH51_06190, partial [Myxococcota bacterium]|nr:hypothetical protein [Myxococcota bacterium]